MNYDIVSPDLTLFNFRASKSVDRRILFSIVVQERCATDFKAPKLSKGSSGCFAHNL